MSIRVMVVDDDPTIRRTLSSALARGGFDVCTANDGGPAIRLAEVTQLDIAVVDYNMPMGGLEVVRQLKRRHGNSLFLAVLTGDDDDDVRAQCLDAGADAVLMKPISPSELRRRLTAAATALQTMQTLAVAS